MQPEKIYESVVYYIVFLFSATVHEAGHAWAARRGGDLTAYLGGQVSLDPRPHIRREPLGMVVLPLLTALTTGWPIGFASAPYDPRWAQQFPRRAAWMALAGPGANLALVLLAAALLHGGILAGVLAQPDAVNFGRLAAAPTGGVWIAVALIVSVLFSMNLVLFALNMLPIPPLDGSGAIPLLLSARATETYRSFVQQPMLAWVGMLLVWRIFGALFHPVFLTAVNLLYPGSGYGR